MTKQKQEHHTHHHWEGTGTAINYLLKWLIIFVILSSVIGIITNLSDNKEYMHKNCLDACSKPHSFWTSNIRIINYDISNCIHNCNSFYIATRKK